MKKIHAFLKNHYLFLGILFLALILRIYKLDTLTTFGGDQGIDFLVVRDMVLYHKWTLLGIKTSISPFFQGPLYLYILFPFFLLFKLNPLAGPIAAITVSIATIIILYITASKYFSKSVAIFSSILFAASPEFIMYGNTPLYQHFLPLFIIISLYLFLSPKKTFISTFLLGLSIGLGIELHLLNITLTLAILAYFLLFTKNKIKKIIGFLGGVIIGLLPTLIFEMRHQFLNTNLFLNFEHTQNTSLSTTNILKQWTQGASVFLAGNNFILGTILLIFLIAFLLTRKQIPGSRKEIIRLSLLTLFFITAFSLKFSVFAPHYILPFWIISLLLLPVMIEQLIPKRIGIVVMIIIIGVNLLSSVNRLNNNHGYTMPDGWTMKKITQAGKIISQDSLTHANFNVASVLDGNTRTYPTRYIVLTNGAVPGDVDQYPQNDFLYITARSNPNDLIRSKTWEITSLSPFNIGKKWNLGDNIYLYRLDRNK